MKCKLLGKSRFGVSELCLGTMKFGEEWDWGSTKEISKEVFNKFTNEGGNFIGTTCNYTNGTSVKFIGEFIKGDHDRFVIAKRSVLDLMYGETYLNLVNHRDN